jgi:hypothetical protein
MARAMGELLAAFRRLPTAGLELQILRMLDLLRGDTSLQPELQRVVADRLRTMLR